MSNRFGAFLGFLLPPYIIEADTTRKQTIPRLWNEASILILLLLFNYVATISSTVIPSKFRKTRTAPYSIVPYRPKTFY